MVLSDAFLFLQSRQIAELALKNRIPSIVAFRQSVKSGGLMSYGTDVADLYRRAATYVDKILKGTKPGDLPVEQPTKLELMVKMKTAKALGLAMPQLAPTRVDQMIQ